MTPMRLCLFTPRVHRLAGLLALGLALSLATLQSASAQAMRPAPPPGWHVTAGFGLVGGPSYEGSGANQVNLVPNLSAGYRDAFSLSIRGAEYFFRPNEDLKLTAIATLLPGRDEDQDGGPFTIGGGETDRLRGMGDIDRSLGLGGAIAYDYGPGEIKAKLVQGVDDTAGLRGELGVALNGVISTPGPPLIWSFGPKLLFQDQNAAQTRFGVSQAQAGATGYAAFSPEGGVYANELSGTLVLPLARDGSSTLVGFGGLRRLEGDAAQSPIVAERTGLRLGLVWGRRFNL
ncbi:MAG: MipA/OmpV family protein [Pseudomonadota bacterium]